MYGHLRKQLIEGITVDTKKVAMVSDRAFALFAHGEVYADPTGRKETLERRQRGVAGVTGLNEVEVFKAIDFSSSSTYPEGLSMLLPEGLPKRVHDPKKNVLPFPETFHVPIDQLVGIGSRLKQKS